MEEDECDSRGLRGLRGRVSLVDTQVVELSDGRVSRGEHLAVGELVPRAYERGRLLLGNGEHRLAPGPEVASRGASAQRPLERVAVGVHEAGESQPARHAGDASRVGHPVWA